MRRKPSQPVTASGEFVIHVQDLIDHIEIDEDQAKKILLEHGDEILECWGNLLGQAIDQWLNDREMRREAAQRLVDKKAREQRAKFVVIK